MSIDWDTPVSELMHSDDTIGLFESNEELMHFKYIKREKKNGKWVYYYDTQLLKDNLKSKKYWKYKEAEDDMLEAEYMKKQAFENYQQNTREAADGGKFSQDYKKEAEQNKRDYVKYHKQYQEKAKAYLAARNEYMNSPVAKIHASARKVATGAKKVAKWLGKKISGNAKRK